MASTEQHGDGGDNHVRRDLVYLDHSPKTVALVCMGPSCTDYFTPTLTQEYNPDWVDEVWTINMATMSFRSDVVFWMDDLIQQEKFKPNLFRALRRWGMPVITSVRRPEVVPNSFDYPINEVGSIALPVFGKPYLNNGVAMAIGYALWKGVKTMHIFGADFSYPNRDYAESGRGCVEAWVTLAALRNMSVIISPQSSLMDAVKDGGVYGYAEQPEIVLPDGKVFKYIKRSEIGHYVPEDSSGAKNGPVPTSVSRESGKSGTAAVAGDLRAARPVGVDAPAAVGRSGGSVRRPNKPRRAKNAHPTANGYGGRAGDSAPAAEVDVPLHEGDARPGP